MTHHNVIPLDPARMARATRDRPLQEYFAAVSGSGDASRQELVRQRKVERWQRAVTWYAVTVACIAFWYFILKLVGVL